MAGKETESMITLTNAAATRLQHLLAQKDLADCGLRIFVQGGGCAGLQYGLAYESSSREGDTVLDIKGVRLFVDPFSARYLEGATVGYKDTSTGAGFHVDNPNAVAACACGNSFRTEGSRQVQTACEG